MKQITFTFDNIRKIEEFTGAALYSYFEIGTPSAVFKFPEHEETPTYFKQKELKLEEGEIIFKDKDNNIFKKVN